MIWVWTTKDAERKDQAMTTATQTRDFHRNFTIARNIMKAAKATLESSAKTGADYDAYHAACRTFRESGTLICNGRYTA
jgi:hypothetical protein